MSERREIVGYLLMLATAIGWGGAWVTAKLAAHDAPPATVTVGRFVVAALALLPVWLLMERGKPLPRGRDWLVLVAMGATGAATYTVLFLFGVTLAPASDGAVLVPGLSGVFAIAIGSALARRAPPGRAILGASLSLLGCGVVGWNAVRAAEAAETRLLGDAVFVASAVVWATYTILGRGIAPRVSAPTSILAVSMIGAALLAPFALLHDGLPDLSTWSAAAWFNVVYLGLGATALAFVTYYAAIKILGVEKAAPAMGLVPVFGVVGAAVILGEALTLAHAAGGLLVVGGIVLPHLRRR